MKKVLSLIIAIMMIISTSAVLSVSAEEVSAEGNWEVHLDAMEEEKIANGEHSYIPYPGYEYTDDGFEVIPPEYNNVQAKYTVISKTKYSSKNFSIKIRLDEYDASGDNWVSFTFWSEKNGLAQGGNAKGEYGYGWTSLLRDANTAYEDRDMKLSVLQGFSSGTKASPGGFTNLTVAEFEPIVDENGIQYLEFKVENMQISINGVDLGSDNCKALRDAFKNDEYLAYFGISVKSGLANTPIKFTILEVDGVKPTGSDKVPPTVVSREFGEMIDASTIPAGTPGVLFDATFEHQNNKLPTTSKCVVDLTENDTFKITAHDTIGSVGFYVRDEYSVDANDFPYVAIVLKNFCTCDPEDGVSMRDNCGFAETNGFFYCAGKTLAPDNDHRLPLTGECMVDITPEGSEDYYVIIYAKATAEDFLDGPARIHSLRFDFAKSRPTQEFEIMYAGYFRDRADMAAYATAQGYNLSVEDLGEDDPFIDDPSYGDPGEDESDTDDIYEVNSGEEETTKKKENKTTAASDDSSKKGCGSAIGLGTVAIIAVASSAGLLTFKKRKED